MANKKKDMSDPRYEAFAVHYASGMTGPEAYREAGFRDSASNYAKLLGKKIVQNRIAEIQAECLQGANISLTWVLMRQKEVIEMAIESGKTSALADANKGLENLMKHCKELLGLVSDAPLSVIDPELAEYNKMIQAMSMDEVKDTVRSLVLDEEMDGYQ